MRPQSDESDRRAGPAVEARRARARTAREGGDEHGQGRPQDERDQDDRRFPGDERDRVGIAPAEDERCGAADQAEQRPGARTDTARRTIDRECSHADAIVAGCRGLWRDARQHRRTRRVEHDDRALERLDRIAAGLAPLGLGGCLPFTETGCLPSFFGSNWSSSFAKLLRSANDARSCAPAVCRLAMRDPSALAAFGLANTDRHSVASSRAPVLLRSSALQLAPNVRHPLDRHTFSARGVILKEKAAVQVCFLACTANINLARRRRPVNCVVSRIAIHLGGLRDQTCRVGELVLSHGVATTALSSDVAGVWMSLVGMSTPMSFKKSLLLLSHRVPRSILVALFLKSTHRVSR